MDQHIHVLIADHEARTRRPLLALLASWPQIEVVGAATNGVSVIQLIEKYRPDVALMDIKPVVDGLETIRLIKSRQPQVRIVVLTMYTTHQVAALAAGADAFLLKGCPAEALQDAILSPGRRHIDN